MLTLPRDRETHRKLAGEVQALRVLETKGGAVSTRTGPLRVAYWNVQRFHHFEACCALIRRVAPDILLLGEIDIGMARTEQRHCLRDAAAALRRTMSSARNSSNWDWAMKGSSAD